MINILVLQEKFEMKELREIVTRAVRMNNKAKQRETDTQWHQTTVYVEKLSRSIC